MKLPLGKIPYDILKKHVLKFQGYTSPEVLVGPKIGVDFAVVNLDGRYLIISSDPVTGIEEDIGWYAVNVSANDVATSGAKPRFLNSVILLPENSDETQVKNISKQMDNAAKNLQMTIVGGHTEITPNLKQLIVVTTAFGITNQYITAANAEDGDYILMTKTAGIEGTSILARIFKDRLKSINTKTTLRASEMISQISIVKDAAILFGTGKVHAMHDSTEGGIIGGVHEMALASNTGFKLNEKSIEVAKETDTICNILKINPSKLLGSGSLLASVKPDEINSVINELSKHNIKGSVIGKFGGEKKEIIKNNGLTEEVQHNVIDEIWRLAALGRSMNS